MLEPCDLPVISRHQPLHIPLTYPSKGIAANFHNHQVICAPIEQPKIIRPPQYPYQESCITLNRNEARHKVGFVAETSTYPTPLLNTPPQLLTPQALNPQLFECSSPNTASANSANANSTSSFTIFTSNSSAAASSTLD